MAIEMPYPVIIIVVVIIIIIIIKLLTPGRLFLGALIQSFPLAPTQLIQRCLQEVNLLPALATCFWVGVALLIEECF